MLRFGPRLGMLMEMMNGNALSRQLFLDTFTTARTAGNVNNTAAEPGPGETRVVADTGSVITASGGNLVIAGGDATLSHTSIRYGSRARTAGLALRAKLTPKNAVNGAMFGFMNSTVIAAANIANNCIRIGHGSTAKLKIYDGTNTTTVGDYTVDTEQEFMVVELSTGSILLTRGGPYDATNWTILFVNSAGNDATIYPSHSSYDLVNDVAEIELLQLLGSKWKNETVYMDSSASPGVNTVLTGTVNDVWGEFTWTPQTDDVLTLMFRRTDDDNCLKLVCDQAAGTIKLYSRVAGVDAELDAGKTQTWTADTAYRICFAADVQNVFTWVGAATGGKAIAKHSTTTATNPSGKTAKVDLAGSTFRLYPRRVALLTANPFDLSTIDRAYAPNAAAALTTPTYDLSGEAVHPSILYFPSGWNGHTYWMCITPYPGGDNEFENPSILVSENGTDWSVPDGLTNPITPSPDPGYLADAELVMSADGLTMWCIYKVSSGGQIDTRAKSSTDGVTWSEEATIIDGTTNSDLSPAVLWDGTQFVMWSTDYTSGVDADAVLHRRTAPAITGPWSDPTVCTISPTYPTNEGSWHQDMIYDGSRVWAVLNFTDKRDYLAYSDDGGLTWTRTTTPILSPAAGSWDAGQIYKATLLKSGNGFDVWYSANDGGTPVAWHIGKTYVDIGAG